ncbi:MAG TPA: hypothetical protein VGY48_19285 [Vicinamibacterales bacterium]|jgi:pyruvate dehydrogenase E1 component|nr:hypothetical protein [Vicinamibacterales bacterium]
MTDTLCRQILEGGYWLVDPDERTELAIVACGPVITEAIDAHRQILEDVPGAGLLVVTSADRLWRDWTAGRRAATRPAGDGSPIDRLLEKLPRSAGLVTVLDGHAATLSWLGAVRQHRIIPLGVERFGQSGSIKDIYRAHGLDPDAIVEAAARLWIGAR